MKCGVQHIGPNLECRPAGRFHGPIVVTMRPIPKAKVQLASDLSRGYPYAHGSPVHIGRLIWPDPTLASPSPSIRMR